MLKIIILSTVGWYIVGLLTIVAHELHDYIDIGYADYSVKDILRYLLIAALGLILPIVTLVFWIKDLKFYERISEIYEKLLEKRIIFIRKDK